MISTQYTPSQCSGKHSSKVFFQHSKGVYEVASSLIVCPIPVMLQDGSIKIASGERPASILCVQQCTASSRSRVAVRH